MLFFEENMNILFIGDSITDCERSRKNPEDLGSGYPNIIAGMLNVEFAELQINFKNLGISGNRICDLKQRWQSDCIDHKPDIVSIMIGINDVWRKYKNNDPIPAEVFAADYRYILEKTKNELHAQIVIIEPFVLPVPEDRKVWHEDLDPKISAIKELALEFADVYVPMDGIFTAACCRRKPEFWAADGVHPTQAGHMLLAKSWMQYAVGE